MKRLTSLSFITSSIPANRLLSKILFESIMLLKTPPEIHVLSHISILLSPRTILHKVSSNWKSLLLSNILCIHIWANPEFDVSIKHWYIFPEILLIVSSSNPFNILLIIEQHTGIDLGLWSIISTVILIIWIDISLSEIPLFNSVSALTTLPELGCSRLCWWINKNCFCKVRLLWLSWKILRQIYITITFIF